MNRKLTSRRGRPVAGACALAVWIVSASPLAAVELVSVNHQGTGSGNRTSSFASISDDGRLIAFTSRATDLVTLPDLNENWDVFVRDRLAGKTVLVSVRADGGGAGDLPSRGARISGDGRVVVFASTAGDLVPGDDNGSMDVFARDLATGVTELISVRHDGHGPGNHRSEPPMAVSRDGRYVLFFSHSHDLVPPGTPQSSHRNLFMRDRELETTEIVNLDSQGSLLFPSPVQGMSDDGQRVSFGFGTTCYVRDLQAGTTFRIWTGASLHPECRITPDGSRVFFVTEARLAPGDQNIFIDNYYLDLDQGTIEPAAPGPDGQLRGGSPHVAFSADGRYFFFVGDDAFVPGDDNGLSDLIRRDLVTGVYDLVSWNFERTAGAGGGSAFARFGVSRDGRWVVWRSVAPDLVPGDDNVREDLFARNLERGSTVRLTAPWGISDPSAFSFVSSASGDAVVWVTDDDLLPGDVNGTYDVLVSGAAEVFRDSFESGSTSRWSMAVD